MYHYLKITTTFHGEMYKFLVKCRSYLMVTTTDVMKIVSKKQRKQILLKDVFWFKQSMIEKEYETSKLEKH